MNGTDTTTIIEDRIRLAQLSQILDHLNSADAIQQQLLADSFPEMGYEFHNEICNLADQIQAFVEDLANWPALK